MDGAELLKHLGSTHGLVAARVRHLQHVHYPYAVACFNGNVRLLDRFRLGYRLAKFWAERPHWKRLNAWRQHVRERHTKEVALPAGEDGADCGTSTRRTMGDLRNPAQISPALAIHPHHGVAHIRAASYLINVALADTAFEAQLKARVSPVMAKEVLAASRARNKPPRLTSAVR